jgi:hypothetical protein
MPYIPPSMRKPKTEADKLEETVKIIQEASDKHFPQLGNSGPVRSQSSISYAAKALEWEQKRVEVELKEREDAFRAENRARKEEQDRLMLLPFGRQSTAKVMPAPIPVKPTPSLPAIPDEWTTVEKKVRKPKKEKNLEDEPEYNDKFDHLAEDQDSLWD